MRHLGSLQPRPPFDLSILLNILSRFPYATLDTQSDGAYWRVLTEANGALLVRVTQHGTSKSPTLEVDLMGEQGTHGLGDDAILKRVAQVLNIHAEKEAFYALADSHPILSQVVAPLRGLPEWRTDSLYEALVMTVIEQQIAWRAALKAQRWLMEWGGVAVNGRYAYPTPAQLAQASEADLTPTRITFKRMRLLSSLAGQIVSGELDSVALAQLPPQAAYDMLIGLKGIGHWSASVTLERAYGYHAWVAYNDVALQSAANHYWFAGRGRLPAATMLEIYAPFGTYAGQAAYYTLLRWVLDEYPVVLC